MKTTIPQGYASTLNLYDTQTAIGMVHQKFVDNLSRNINLKRVSAPLFVDASTGLNDNLNGTERAVTFDIACSNIDGEVVHSLAKWKRMALHRYGFQPGEGLYAMMNAIRRDEDSLDNLHSVYVDQWDWEKVISLENRTIDTLKETVKGIVNALCDTLDELKKVYPSITTELKRDVTFITTQELEDKYPSMTSKEREDAALKEHKTVFLMEIGGAMKSGEKHDGRAPDYDDWKMNGDILFYNSVLDSSFEVSSMGIRVSPESLDSQLTIAGCDDRRELPFHKMLLNGELPYTIGGGIGQSRVCMLLLGKCHIGEVQSSIWDEDTLKICKDAGVTLL